jgi:hypothetical protein|tara:strand:- start:1838 stop:2062 length:225 start_codon:yes stop_codon:yes gene_type:complete
MIELGMEVMNLNGYLGVVAASPRNGKWLVLTDDGRTVRVREEEMREYDREIEDRICWGDDSPAYVKWLEKRELL